MRFKAMLCTIFAKMKSCSVPIFMATAVFYIIMSPYVFVLCVVFL